MKYSLNCSRPNSRIEKKIFVRSWSRIFAPFLLVIIFIFSLFLPVESSVLKEFKIKLKPLFVKDNWCKVKSRCNVHSFFLFSFFFTRVHHFNVLVIRSLWIRWKISTCRVHHEIYSVSICVKFGSFYLFVFR